MQALERAARETDAEFDKLPPTMGRAFGVLGAAMDNYLRAFDAFGADRLERNRVKPAGMTAREWLESYVARQSTWDKGRKTGLTGIQALSGKDLWPTDDGSGERLRKAMANT